MTQRMKWPLEPMPNTLDKAIKALAELQPSVRAPAREWRNYYQLSAEVFAGLSDIDRFHHHQAQYHAAHARAKVRELDEQLRG